MTEERPRYYTVSQAAEELDVSRSTIWRWIGEGRLNAYRAGPKTVRIRQEDLDAILQPKSPVNGDEIEDIWKDYDPEKARAAMRAAIGALRGVDTEKLKKDIRAARGQSERRQGRHGVSR